MLYFPVIYGYLASKNVMEQAMRMSAIATDITMKMMFPFTAK